jgi:[ribosomal protein S5]-alanine N-acetyltransferase
MSPELMQAILDADWPSAEAAAGVALPRFFRDERWGHLQYRLGLVRADPGALPWLTRLMVCRQAPEAVGHIGFHEPPRAGRDWVEVGYTVFPEHRRQGYAEEAVRGLFEWAAQEGVHRFRASVGPWNQPSLNLVRKLGLVQTGVQVDEIDGEELIFETG